MMRRILGFVIGALLWSASARADDASDLEQLLEEPVVTTASKSAEVSSAAPGTASTITAEDLRRYGIRTLDEALDYLSLGFVTQSALKDPNVGARGVMLPGDQGNHVLLLINGHPVNEPLFGAARFGRGLGIPMELVDHIEVILGPGSVLYGSNAMLGIVNVVMILPRFGGHQPKPENGLGQVVHGHEEEEEATVLHA